RTPKPARRPPRRAWAAIERYYTNCRERRPGKKGSPRFPRDCRSVEDQPTGWRLDAEGKRLTLTDGYGWLRHREGAAHRVAGAGDGSARAAQTGAAAAAGGWVRRPRRPPRGTSHRACPQQRGGRH